MGHTGNEFIAVKNMEYNKIYEEQILHSIENANGWIEGIDCANI